MFDVKQQQLQSPNIPNSQTVNTMSQLSQQNVTSNRETIGTSKLMTRPYIQSHNVICIQHVAIHNKIIHKLMNLMKNT